MADKSVVHIGENSPEKVAFDLLIRVGVLEGKLNVSGYPDKGVDRKWILDTYAECLEAVRGYRDLKD